MDDAIEQVQAKDTKERMAGVERLQTVLEQSRKGLSSNEVGSLVDAALVLLKDNNFRVSQGALQALASASALAGEHLKLHFNALLPAIVERLGDGKQPVRDAGRRLLLALMEISSPTIIVERAGNCAWAHRNWRVREEFARSVASAINLFAATELPFQRMLLPSVLQLLEDSNSGVREAAMLCLEEMFRQGGAQFRDELHRHPLRPAQVRDVAARFDKIAPRALDLPRKPAPNPSAVAPPPAARRGSPRLKAPASEASSAASGDGEAWAAVEAVRVYSERELTREMDRAAGLLAPEQDWAVRIAAMQRLEGLVRGGAAEYPSFAPALRQLVGPLCAQLSDRRSSIVKQACHLLNLLSKELEGDFEIFAESFVPVLFKLVVITVLVIAESADTCIRTLLRNCRVGRVLPKLADCAKHDRSAVLRARCCEYALLVLQHWGDSPEVLRAADLYEDLVRCCVADAMSEVRAAARACFRAVAKAWPDRARRMFVAFDPSVQRLLNDEDGGGAQRRFLAMVPPPPPPPPQPQPQLPQAQLLQGSYAQQLMLRQSAGMATASSTALAHSSSSSSSAAAALAGLGIAGNSGAYQKKLLEGAAPPAERSLDSVLQASQQQIAAVENMLRGVDIGGGAEAAAAGAFGGSYRRIHVASVAAGRAGVDPPSVRDPPQPAAASRAAGGGVRASVAVTTLEGAMGGSAGLHHFAKYENGPQSWDADVVTFGNPPGKDRPPAGSAFAGASLGRRAPSDAGIGGEWGGGGGGLGGLGGLGSESKGAKRVPRAEFLERGYMDRGGGGGGGGGGADSNGIPGFQRPLLRQNAAARASGGGRSMLLAMEENPVLAQFNALGGGGSMGGEAHSYMDGLMSLNDALSEGLSSGADWSARVAAFTFLRNLLQQGQRGAQDIAQSFGLVMKLFSAHLDDPHHKVAQAALTTLGELVPACRKPFEAYLERILPQVFARLVDSKEVIRQLGGTALDIVRNTYNIDSLLPALLRSLDEQRSPKAKMAVIDFAVAAFAKLALGPEPAHHHGGGGLLKLWLAKLGPLANDKNPKLKETAVTGIISVYSHFDSTTVLNFILSLSIEEQSHLRRSLKQYTPRIEVDLMAYLQSRSQRGRPKPVYDATSSDAGSSISDAHAARTLSSSGAAASASAQPVLNPPLNSFGDGGRKPESSHPEPLLKANRFVSQMSGGRSNHEHYSATKSAPGEPFEPAVNSPVAAAAAAHFGRAAKEPRNGLDEAPGRSTSAWINEAQQIHRQSAFVEARPPHDHSSSSGSSGGSLLESHAGATSSGYGYLRSSSRGVPLESGPTSSSPRQSNGDAPSDDDAHGKGGSGGRSNSQELDSPVPHLARRLETWSGGAGLAAAEKREALQQLATLVSLNDVSLRRLDSDRILNAMFESLDDSESAVKELALSLVYELLGAQKEILVDSTERLLDKLLRAAQDPDLKVYSAADRCLTAALKELDAHRCLAVVVPRLVSDDEKALVVCIGSLTKLVGRFPSVDLMAELPSFLPALFEAFGNQNADVRKTVVFCLVDIYIVLGKAFVPYLGSLSSTQLRLVTIYANRISQARTGTTLESQLQ